MIFTQEQLEEAKKILSAAGRQDLANVLILEVESNQSKILNSQQLQQKYEKLKSIINRDADIASIIIQARKVANA